MIPTDVPGISFIPSVHCAFKFSLHVVLVTAFECLLMIICTSINSRFLKCDTFCIDEILHRWICFLSHLSFRCEVLIDFFHLHRFIFMDLRCYVSDLFIPHASYLFFFWKLSSITWKFVPLDYLWPLTYRWCFHESKFTSYSNFRCWFIFFRRSGFLGITRNSLNVSKYGHDLIK